MHQYCYTNKLGFAFLKLNLENWYSRLQMVNELPFLSDLSFSFNDLFRLKLSVLIISALQRYSIICTLWCKSHTFSIFGFNP